MTKSILQTAVEHHRAGRLEDAEVLYRRVIEIDPRNADAWYLLGMIAREKGMNDSAVEMIERAHRYQRPQAISLNHLGEAYVALGRFPEARKCFARALAIKPGDAELHRNLGSALSMLGKSAEAITCYRRAIALEPRNPGAHFGLGQELEKIGRLDEAAQNFTRALQLQPGAAQVHVSLGGVLQDLGRLVEAEASYRSALAIDPELALAHNNLGALLQQCRRLEEAEQSFRNALEHGSGEARTHCNLGNVLYDLGRLQEAAQCYGNAAAIAPDLAEARWALAIAALPSLEAEPRAGGESGAALREVVRLGEWFEAARPALGYMAVGSLQPFYLAYEENNHRDTLAGYGKLCSRLMQRWYDEQHFRPAKRARGDLLRVGIVSAHVHEHSVWDAIAKGWMRHLDRGRFDLSVFHLGAIQDDETALAKTQSAHFEQAPRTLRQWVEAIRARQCDALIYPEIGMDATTLRLAALRLAPVQFAAWGHPMTTGLPTIDHYLSAQLFEPEGAAAHYSEQLAVLPNLGVCYEPRETAFVEPDLASLGIESGSPILLCPGVAFKYAARYDRLLAEIARGLGRCQMVFFSMKPLSLSEALEGRLRKVFAEAQLDFEQHCLFVPRQEPAAFHGLMRRADVFLDTIGFSGFNTAMQAVRCGLPIVTRAGRFMRGSFAAGILKRIGLQELVVNTESEYVALALRLARDRDYSRDIRARIGASRGALYGDLEPVRALEELIARTVAQADAGGGAP